MNQVEIKRKQIQLCAIVLWLAAIWLFGKQIGDNGITYLAASLEVFLMLWALLGANLADTMGRLLRGRNARGQYKNADKLRNTSLIFAGALGLAGCFFLLVAAPFLAERLLRVPYCRFLIQLLAPVLLLRCISCGLLGSFQGGGSELPTVVVALLRPLLFMGFGFLFVRRLTEYGEKVSKLLGRDDFYAMYGAIGLIIALILVEVLILVFLLLIYRQYSVNRRKREGTGMRSTDSVAGQIYVLCGSMWNDVVLGVLIVLPMVLALIFYQKNASDIYTSVYSYGIYLGKYFGVCGVVIALLAAFVCPTGMKAGGMNRREEYRNARSLFAGGLKSVVVYSLFFTVFLMVMAQQAAQAVTNSMVSILAEMFMKGSGIVLLGTIVYYCYTVLKQAGKKLWLLAEFAAADVICAVVMALWLGKTPDDILIPVYCGLLYCGLLAVMLCVSCCIVLRCTPDLLRTFAIPVACICAVGLLCHLLGNILTPHLGGAVTLLAVFVIAWLLYFTAVVFLRCFREHEAALGGKMIRLLGQILGLF